MTISVGPGASFEASVFGAGLPSGLVGTLGVRIEDGQGTTVTARSTAAIVEHPAGSGLYVATRTSPTTAGTYFVLWDDGAATPGHVSAEDLIVTTSALVASVPSGSDLCTVADVKLRIGIGVATDDGLIQVLITAASAAIQTRYQREFAPVSGTATRRVRSDGRLIDLSPYDLRSASGITIDPAGTPLALLGTDWRLGAVDTAGTYRSLRLRNTYSLSSRSFADYGYYELDITGTWGFSAIPPDVADACVTTVAAWIDRGADQIAGFDATVRPDGSTVSSSWAIPTAAHRLLQPYERQVF